MTLNQRIQHFYDRSTQLWLDVWGEHMHHGYYGADGTERKEHRQAQIDLIEALLRWGEVDTATHILDVGCGVGGSARYLAQKLDAEVLGLTLSPVQAERGAMYNRQADLEDQVVIRTQDMMTLTEADGPFDLIWSLESAEHIADKRGLLEMFHTLLKPGGKFLMVTWCHRDVPPALTAEEGNVIENICKLYHLPPMISPKDYENRVQELGFQNIKTADWSEAVKPFWGAVIRSAMSWRSVRGLIRSGWSTMRGAYAMRYMQQGFRQGIIKYALIQGQKP